MGYRSSSCGGGGEKGRRERKVSDVKDREKGIFVTKLTFQKYFSFFNKCEFTCNLFII